MISETCKIDLVHNPKFPQNFIYNMGPDNFLIYSPQLTWTLSCPSKLDKLIQHSGLFSVHIQCQCTLSTQDNLLGAVDTQCVHAKHTVNYSINWFVYTALYKSFIPRSVHFSSLHDQPLDFQLPPSLVNASKLRTLEQRDQATNRYALDMFNITHSSPDSFDMLEWIASSDTSSATLIISIICIILNLALAATVFYLFRRLTTVQQLLIASKITLKSADALHLTLPPTVPTTTLCPPLVIPYVNLTILCFILGFLLIALLFFLYRRFCFSFSATQASSTPPSSSDVPNPSSPPLYPDLPTLPSSPSSSAPPSDTLSEPNITLPPRASVTVTYN